MQSKPADSSHVIGRVCSDLRNEIYGLMTHERYHALEKQLTEEVLNSDRLFSQLRRFATNQNIPFDQKAPAKELFAYTIYRRMNEVLGGFHFNRYRSLSTGMGEVRKLMEVVEAFDFDDFYARYDEYQFLKDEPDFAPFAESRQSQFLEDSITTAIKRNNVIPDLSRAIASDVVKALNLSENYVYIYPSDNSVDREFDVPEALESGNVSLKRVTVLIDTQPCGVLLKRASRNSTKFKLLLTNFGALIKGDT